MINNIPLTNNLESPFPAKFFLSAKVCQNAGLSALDAQRLGRIFSAAPSLYINRYIYTNNDGETEKRYDVFFSRGVFTCVAKKEYGNFQIIFFSDQDFHKKRLAIGKGISFSLPSILLTVQYATDFFNFENGETVKFLSEKNCSQSLTDIDRQFDQKQKEVIPSSAVSPELEVLLKQAEAYSETDYTLAEAEALINGKLFYQQVSPSKKTVGDQKNYIFHCLLSEEQRDSNNKKSLKQKWKQNAIVKITLNDERTLSASIFQADLDCDQPFVELTLTTQTDFSAIPPSGFLRIPLSNTIRNTQRKAFRQIREQAVPAAFLDDVLGAHSCKPHKAINKHSLSQSIQGQNPPLNHSQQKAILEALAAQDIYLVMGPPGTGKTTVIAQWVKYLVCEENARVLIASQNNSAVDNVLKKLKGLPGLDMLRLSSTEQKVDDDVVEAFYKNKVDATRSTIAKKVEGNRQYLADLQIKWDGLESSFHAIASIYETYQTAKRKIAESITAAANHYTKARTMFPAIYKGAKKFQARCRRFAFAEKLYNAYYRFEPIREIFFYIGIIMRNRLKHRAQKILRDRAFVQTKIDSYNKEIQAYHTLLHQVLTALQRELEDSTRILQEKIRFLDLKVLVNDPLGIFSLDSELLQNIEDPDNFHAVFKALSAGQKKLSGAATILKDWQEHIANTQNYAIESILLQSANVVGATCVGISSNPCAENLVFDVVIIDEAGQIQIHNSLIPMRLGKKVIMLGDHMQLPPVAKLEALQILEGLDIDWSLYTKSLFEELYDKLPKSNKTMLDTQYRMPKIVADILSAAFYKNKYKSHESKNHISSGIEIFNNKPFVVIDTSDSNRRREDSDTHSNEYEAEICEKIFTEIVKQTGQTDNVAIIAGLNSQVELLRERIDAKYGQAVAKHVVHTVDSYQGQECNTVIFSFTRSSSRLETSVRIGFLSELRRLNVAMSRCKRCLVLVGDMDFLTQCKNTTGFDGIAEKGITGTEEKFSGFLEDVLSAAQSHNALRLPSKAFYERLGDEHK